MKQKKRFNYDILGTIIGKEFDEAEKICNFNGYALINSDKYPNGFYYINYELEDNKVVKSYFKNILNK
jgi:hypothetical protein